MLGPASNPLTRTESEALRITNSLIETHYLAQTASQITEVERLQLFRKIHIQLLDLERGGSLERAVLTVLAVRGAPSPDAAWAELISLSMSLAKDRLSIDSQGLDAWAGHLITADEGPQPAAADAALRSALEGTFPADKDVVLTTIEGRTVIAELFRFDSDGARRLRYEEGRVLMSGGGSWDLIRRTATMSGMERLLASDRNLISADDVVLVPTAGGDSEGGAVAAVKHAAACRQLLADNTDLLGCLRCGRPVTEDLAPYIEIDETGAEPEIGLVHSACLSSTHRVIGTMSGEALARHVLLKDFDYRTWINAISVGQGLFNGLPAALRGRLSPLAWKPGRAHLSVGRWGVLYETEDGAEQFMVERGRVRALTRRQAEDQGAYMSEALQKAAKQGDPFCVVGEPLPAFGTYSSLLRFGEDAQPMRVVAASARELSRATIRAQSRVDHYYAPLLVLFDADTNEVFSIGGAVVLLTDPLRLSDAVANWTAAGLDVPGFGTAIIATDDQFDALVASSMLTGLGVVVDPRFNMRGEPASGVVVEYLEALLANGQAMDGDSAA